MRKLLVFLVFVVGGLAFVWLVLSLQENQKGGSSPLFASASLVTLEDAQDYPDEPRALHPAQLHVVAPDGSVKTYAAPQASRARPVIVTGEALLYFDTDERAVVDAVTGAVVPETHVREERFGGFMAATREVQPRVAYGKTSARNGEFVQELLLLSPQTGTTDGAPSWTTQQVWQSTSKEPSVVVPLAWADDAETIFFSTRAADASPSAPFGSLTQLRIPSAELLESDLALEPSSVAFPSETAQLLGLSTDSNLALFLDEPPSQQETLPDEDTDQVVTLTLVDLAVGNKQAVALSELAEQAASMTARSVSFGDQTALAIVTEAGASEERLLLIQFGLDQPTELNLEGTGGKLCRVEGSDATVWFSQPITQRGTWKKSLIGEREAPTSANSGGAKISQFECVGFASIPR